MNSPRQTPCSLARRGPRGSSSSSTHGLPPLLLLVSAALALLLPTTAAQSTDAPCFFPNSTAAAADMAPCGGAGADTTHSHCCNQGWACLSNGLCMAAGQDPAQLAGATLVRGACTDQTWTSPDCPRWCTNAEDLDDLNVPQPIAACQAVPGAFYCANSDDAADCDEEEEVIRFSGTFSPSNSLSVLFLFSTTTFFLFLFLLDFWSPRAPRAPRQPTGSRYACCFPRSLARSLNNARAPTAVPLQAPQTKLGRPLSPRDA